jgi:phosphatidylglycerophosphatase A
MKFMVKLFTSGFFIGYFPRGSGTVASVMACVIWLLLSGKGYYPLFPLFFTVTGFTISGYAERIVFKEPDSSMIVIDEIAGMFVTYTTFSFSWSLEGFLYLGAGFFFFRVFDIVKPVPIGYMQKLRGSAGIMLDDLLSAVIANGLLQLMRVAIFR